MSYLWDTDTSVYFLNGVQSVKDRASSVPPPSICITTLSLAELRYGCYKSAKVEHNLKRVHDLTRSISVISELTDSDATIFGRTKADMRKRGLLVGDVDLLIASIALSRDMTLVSNNEKHYRNIPGLRIENWRQG